MNLGVAASRQSAAIRGNNSQRRSAETPLRGGGSWRSSAVGLRLLEGAVELVGIIGGSQVNELEQVGGWHGRGGREPGGPNGGRPGGIKPVNRRRAWKGKKEKS